MKEQITESGVRTKFFKYGMKGDEIQQGLEFLNKIGYKRTIENAVATEEIELIEEIKIEVKRNIIMNEDEVVIKIIIYDDRDIINFGKEITINQNNLCNKLEEIHKALQEEEIEHYTWRE